ncbi:MAG: replication-relaxation family protein [Deltaproteobacteria bacterium]|nr:replication-relaxation family protein [Deltaproteobacteria bacterium]
MSFKLNKNDRQLLATIAEHRVLTISQITAIQSKSKHVVRRRLNMLEEAGFVLSGTVGFGQGRGRPEKTMSLAEKGSNLLRSEDEILRNVPQYTIGAERIRCLEHQLLTNWFRIHLSYIQHVVPHLSVHFLSPTSPFLRQNDSDLPLIFEPIYSEAQHRNPSGFIPDGVFSITHREKEMTLLFFLEVDMGTETIASSRRTSGDVRQKIINYQQYFRSARYGRYEKYWNCKMRGFRLLFLTNTNSRLVALSRLVREMSPSDFIWLTSLKQMFSHGLSGEIWVRGGKKDAPPESILGTAMAFNASLPSPKP